MNAPTDIELLTRVVSFLVHFVEKFGYAGIFAMTFLESTFMPIPSEVTMIPAGYLVQQGAMNLGLAYGCSVAGTLAGSLFNYWIAAHFGRWALVRWGRYFFMNEARLRIIERYFESHGSISIFTGRLIPGVRHFISFPAGLAHMNLRRFCVYTTLGGAIWMAVLMGIGYFIGQNEALVHHYVAYITKAVLLGLAGLVGLYVWRHRKKKKL